MIKDYIALCKAQWDFFLKYGWKIALVVMVISAIVLFVFNKKIK